MITNDLRKFAAEGMDFYVAFDEYYACKNDSKRTPSIPMAEMSEKIHSGLIKEMERLSGVPKSLNENAWTSHPAVQWSFFAIQNELINSLLPQYMTNSLSPFVDFRTVGYGDVVKFKITPKTLFVVSRGGGMERTSFRQKQYAGDATLVPEEHLVTVYSDWLSVVAGKEDFAEAIRLAVISIERDMTLEAVKALNDGLSVANNYPSQFIVNGAFSSQSAIQLAQKVQAYNFGAKPVFLGTAAALSKVLPDYSAGFRMNVAGADGSVRFMKDFYGFDLVELPQIPSGNNFGMMLDDNTLYVVPTSVDKVVKGVMCPTMTNTNQFFDNADVTTNYTLRRWYAFSFISAGYAGLYKITA